MYDTKVTLKNSKITIRILSRKKGTVIDDAFLMKRVRDAWEYRKETIDTFFS